MIVLGLNGFKNEHDPSAALLIDGKLVGFAEEERFIRMKRATHKYPHNAVRWVLKQAGLTIDDVELFALGWDLNQMTALGERYEFSSRMEDETYLIECITGCKRKSKANLQFVPHHVAHAAASYYASGYKEASVLVVDGAGEDDSISCFHAKGSELKLIRKWNKAYSLGFFYEAASMYSGFTDWDAGKTMGLASYAQGEPLDDFFRMEQDELVLFNHRGSYQSQDLCQTWIDSFVNRFGEPSVLRQEWSPVHNKYMLTDTDDVRQYKPIVAACAQETLVKVLRDLLHYTMRQTGCRDVCLGGGVSLNCAANGRLLPECDHLYLFPAANDAGVSYGAAAYVAAQNGDQLACVTSALTGPDYPTDSILDYLKHCGVSYKKIDDPAEAALQYLINEKVVGWFQNRMEMGPRALGARSILALPNGRPGRNFINDVKVREHWRPFAPSMLAEDQKLAFREELISRFMLLGLECNETAKALFPDAIHVDNTSRPHTVLPEDGAYFQLLKRMRKETGHGIVLNTSFNGPAEPIVCSPIDAIRTFFSTGMDVLVLDQFVIHKNGGIQ